MISKPNKNAIRMKRHARIRNTISGTAEVPRICVFRSNKNIYAQLIDDVTGTTLVSASTLEAQLKTELASTSNKEAAKKVGELLAKRALEKGIQEAVFDRSGYVYHGKIKELADGAREAGLNF